MSLGKVAYDAYGTSVGWKTVGGTVMPEWDSQFDRLKEAWEAAAQAVIAAKDSENVPYERES